MLRQWTCMHTVKQRHSHMFTQGQAEVLIVCVGRDVLRRCCLPKLGPQHALQITHVSACPTCTLHGSGSRVRLASARGVPTACLPALLTPPTGFLSPADAAAFPPPEAAAAPFLSPPVAFPAVPALASAGGCSGAVARSGGTRGSGRGAIVHLTAGTGVRSAGNLFSR